MTGGLTLVDDRLAAVVCAMKSFVAGTDTLCALGADDSV